MPLMFGRALQDLNRLRQIAAAMARHGFGAYLERMRLRDVLGREAPPPGEPLPAPDRATAARFRQMLAELGPTFIKLGQILSSRPDLLPAHWVEELSSLQDDCPPLRSPRSGARSSAGWAGRWRSCSPRSTTGRWRAPPSPRSTGP